MTPEQIARVCHEAMHAYCLTIGDHTQSSWDTAPHWSKDSAVAGVKAVMATPKISAQALHEAWLKTKETQGWKYGPVKVPEQLQHPCMVSYTELPPEQKFKDVLFIAIVKALTTPLDAVPEAVVPPAPIAFAPPAPAPEIEIKVEEPEPPPAVLAKSTQTKRSRAR